ncbi:MAG: CHAT domain-containing protein, partial [Gammaproteobacteria bacterium]|nr:CHAT domain-containing protein [Gammaproteobacteria bacterium]
VLHYIGHGDFRDGEGVLLLESEELPGTSAPLTGRRLATLLRNHLGSLRLVFLNSCLSGAASAHSQFTGVAQSLMRRGMPAVIAMQFPVPDRAAVALAREFYRYVAAGLPIDAALTSARAFLFAKGYEVEWGAPALHMRTPDARLFAIPGAPESVVATSGTTQPPAPPPGDLAPADSGPVKDGSGRRIGPVLAGLVALAAVALAAGVLLFRGGAPTDPAPADSDGDGISDIQDAFPYDAGESRDSDGDGIGDNADSDDDNDGTIDDLDAFPYDASESQDSDGDGTGDNADPDDDNDNVPDDLDAFPSMASETQDSDGDGIGDNADTDDDNDNVADDLDACPDTPEGVRVDADGCARKVDSDGDGVPDQLDKCPGTPGGVPVSRRGCEFDGDGDGDGVTDPLDRCPGTARGARVDSRGCELQMEIRLPGVQFESNSATLAGESAAILDDSVATLRANPELNIEVSGHTDSTESYGQQLSHRRAETVYNYLLAQGVAANSLTTKGYGDAQPIAANSTPSGRSANRRVELRIRDAAGPSGIDTDNDGVNDAVDAFPNDASEAWDNDGDGIGDNADTDDDNDGLDDRIEYAMALDPSRRDSNGNGIADADEDFDGDGLSNGQEVADGSDPMDAYDPDTGTDTGVTAGSPAGRWIARGHALWLQPSSGAQDEPFAIDDAWGAGLGLEYRLRERLGLEAAVAATNLDVDGQVGFDDMSYRQLTLGMNFHIVQWPRADIYLGPVVGLIAAGRNFDSDLAWGAKIGVDIPINPRWQASGRLVYLETTLDTTTPGGSKLELDPVQIAVGFSWRF